MLQISYLLFIKVLLLAEPANLFLHGSVEVAGFTVMLLLKLHEFISIPLESSSEALEKTLCKMQKQSGSQVDNSTYTKSKVCNNKLRMNNFLLGLNQNVFLKEDSSESKWKNSQTSQEFLHYSKHIAG